MARVSERLHDIDSFDCWCNPQFFIPCDECDGKVGCWKCRPITFPDGSCSSGLIEIDKATAALDDVACIVSHNS